MKKTLVTLMGLSLALLIGCEDKGVSRESLIGNEIQLPPELKGLKIYDVSIGSGNYVKVAIMDNKAISTTYAVGKHQQSMIIIDKNNQERKIGFESIISENDSIMVIKKSTK